MIDRQQRNEDIARAMHTLKRIQAGLAQLDATNAMILKVIQVESLLETMSAENVLAQQKEMKK